MAKSKVLKRVLIGLCIFIGAIALILLAGREYFRLPILNYYMNSEKAFKIPGLNDNFVPQGISFDPRTDYYFVTGYTKGDASPVYVVTGKKEAKKVNLANEDGSKFTGHAGGLSVYGDYVYIAGSSKGCLFVYSYEEILNAKDGDTVTCKGKFLCGLGNDFEDHIKVAYTTTFDGYIAVGEFHRPLPSYESPETHKFTTACGDYNEALITIYKFDEDCEFGINPVPELAFSITDKAQGLAFQDDYMYLSTSSGAAFSNIYKYDLSKVELIGVMKVDGNEFPLYGVDSACLVDTYKIAPMAEEIEFVNGKMYTMCESASNSYIFGRLTGATYCYATNLK